MILIGLYTGNQLVIVQTYLEIDGYARYKVPPVSFRPRMNL